MYDDDSIDENKTCKYTEATNNAIDKYLASKESSVHSKMIELRNLDDKDTNVTTAFMKNDSGKNMLSLIDPAFVVLLGEILSFGAKKYAPNNWKLCEDTSRYKDALLRHIYAYLSGEQVDPESGLSHLGHAAFGLMCLNYFDNINKETITCQ